MALCVAPNGRWIRHPNETHRAGGPVTTLVATIGIPSGPLGGFCFSPNGLRLAIGLAPGAGACLVDTRTRKVQPLAPYVDATLGRWPHPIPTPIGDFAFLPGGANLLGLTTSGALLTWQVASGKLTQVGRSPSPPTSGYWSGPFGQIMALQDGRVALIAPGGIAVRNGPRWAVTAIPPLLRGGIEIDGGRGFGLLCTAPSGEVIRDASGRIVSRITRPDRWLSVCSSDGGETLIATTISGTCEVWRRAATGRWRRAAALPTRLRRPRLVSCSAGGRYVMLWASPRWELLPYTGRIVSGRGLFRALGKGLMELLRLSDGVVLRTWSPHAPVTGVQAAAELSPFRVAFAPSGNKFAVAERGVARIRVYRIPTNGVRSQAAH